MDLSKYLERIENHYRSNWKGEYTELFFEKGPINKLPLEFKILKFHPNSFRDMWTYSTCGMSLSEVSPYIELHIFSKFEDDSITELLTAIAYYHMESAPLNLNHSVNFGKSWIKGSDCEYGFISLPYLDGPKLEWLNLHEMNRKIRFLWLIPITQKELEYKKKYGVESLEDLFEESDFNYLDPFRKSKI